MLQSTAIESQITTTLKLLNSSIANDLNGLTLKFNKFLQLQQPYLITFMNYQFFSSDHNLINFLNTSLKNQMKSDEDVRKIVYGFVGDYIVVYKEYVGDYICGIFQKMCGFFKMETAFRPKIQCLGPIKQILTNFPPTDIANFVNPKQYHKSLTYILKVDNKMAMTVKGQIWVLVGILQNKFASHISYTDKKDVQIACLIQLKQLVKKNQNFSTIACILRSFAYSLSQNYLENGLLDELFNYTKAIMIPLADTFGASIAALELIIAQSLLFHPNIMKNAIPLFKTLTGLMGHQNKEYKFTVLDTLAVLAKQIVIGISADVTDQKMIEIFNFIGNTMWSMLKQQTQYSASNTVNEERNRFYSSVISIVKILGTLSPLILSINGKRDLKRFFSQLLKICNRKVIRAFEQTAEGTGITKKIHVMKLILYNQKELVSFIGSFAKILEHLEQIQELEALSLEQLFLVGVRQYPFFLQKYIPDLVEAMVHFLMGLYTKPHIFTPWCKKLVLISLMQSLDAKRFNINTNQDYYQMIKKSSTMWCSILTHTAWKAQIRKEFSNIVFDTLEHLFLNLDISYKTSMELDLQNQQQQRLKQQQLELVNIFFMSDENLQMSNIADYQYVSSLSLIFNQLMLNVDTFLYTQRVYGFYEQIIYRIKIFPKSIPLMKVIRSLNCFIVKNNWFDQQNRNEKENKELSLMLANFFKFCSENIYKLQENYFYQALKMLMSLPLKVFLQDKSNILKNSLSDIISKSLQLGQQIITLAHETIKCLANLFKNSKQESVLYLSKCIPYLQKYINFNKTSQSVNSQNSCQQKQQVRSYLFLYEININRKQISIAVMKFLGSIGGLSHLMIQNSTKDYISWDYYCKLDLTVILGGQNVQINLTKLLARTCWLMQHGSEVQKVVSSQFMHAITVYTIGRAAFRIQTQQTAQQSKQNLSNFFDRVLPTILTVSSNQSHPCQQLMHTLTIQTIHFLANTQDSNSPDIQTLLKNLISLYTGAEDLSFLASKCLSELVKWHIKQAPQVPNYPFPLVKTVIRNVWSLISNKKARNGLIQFLIKFLKAIHRHAKLMSIYAIQLCSLIISMGRSDKQIEPLLDYLVKKYILAIGPYIKSLILEQDSRRFRKLSTLQKLIQWIFNNSLFSIYKQQRIISYNIWQAILNKYGSNFNCDMQSNGQNPNYNIRIFLRDIVDRESSYLFPQSKVIQIYEQQPKLDKQLPKITAYGEIWNKIVDKNIFQVSKLIKFKDFQEVYLKSLSSFLRYLCGTFCALPSDSRVISYQTQKAILDCILTFINLYLSLQRTKNHKFISEYIPFYDKHSVKGLNLIEFLLKLVFKPNSVFTNFNYDLIYECSQNITQNNTQKQNELTKKQLQQNYYFITICSFIKSALANMLLPTIEGYIRKQFRNSNIRDIIRHIVVPDPDADVKYFDREIKCVLATLAIFGNSVDRDNQLFNEILKKTLKITAEQIEESNNKSIHDTSEPKKPTISNQKKSLLIWYLLEHSQNYSIIHEFLVGVIKNDTIIYQKYEKNIMKSIIHNWYSIGQKIINLVIKNHHFLKLIFILCKVLPGDKKTNLYSLIQKHLVGLGMRQDQNTNTMSINRMSLNQKDKQQASKKKATLISQMLKICFYFVETAEHISSQFEIYINDIICEGMDIGYTMDIHEQSLNLAGLIIRQNTSSIQSTSYSNFIQRFRKNLSKLTTYYIPHKISKLPSSDSRNKSASYLKLFKSFLVLSNNLRYLQFIFILLKDRNLQNYYWQLIQDVIYDCLYACYESAGSVKQYDELLWMIGFYWEPGLDTDCWANIRVVFVDQIMRKAIKLSKQQVLIRFFQEQAEKLLTYMLKIPINPTMAIKQIILQLELKRAAFGILQQLYSHLPKKQKNTEDIYKKQLHKQVIKYCNETLKPKLNQISMNTEQVQIQLKQYDRKMAEQQKQKILVLKTQKSQPRIKAIDYLKKYYCGAYNCLIVIFISTQSNKAHFQTYLFQSKGLMWRKLLDEEEQDFAFEIQTSFTIMEPITKINKKLNKKIKDKYWQSSLYAIQQQYVPASLIEADEPNPQQPEPSQIEIENPTSAIQSQKLQLDHINKHPCMINLLRVIDFMHEKFYDGTLPGWMKPIHDELSGDNCPLAVRILLTKLIINRPKIFTQTIWAEILLKYLNLKQNGGKFIHYYFRDVLKHYLSFISASYKPQNMGQINQLAMKVIKALPHQNLYIYNDNMEILNNLLRIEGIWINKPTVISMLKANQKSKPDVKLKFQWRMCIAMVLKCCMEYKVPVIDETEAMNLRNYNNLNKFKFYYELRSQGWINLIFQMAGQSVKKYRIAASGFLGQLLKFVIGSPVDRLQQEQLIKLIAKFLSNMNMQQSNRNSKQKFSLCILNVATRFPGIIDDVRVYGQIETSLAIYCKQQRLQILQTVMEYVRSVITKNKGAEGYLPNIFITIRSIITNLLNDIQEVQSTFISLLHQCCRHEILINKEIIQTYYYIYQDLERIYANSINQKDALNFYKIVIAIKDFTNDPDLPKTKEIRLLSEKVSRTLLKGLGSAYEEIRKLLFEEFQRASKDYVDSAERMLDILVKMYDIQHENLWLINVVPLIFSLVKQSSDYTRLRFEKPLADITSYYDWDFRKNIKAYNSSQPFTPAFTLSTGAMVRRPDGTLQPSFNPTMGGDKLKGIIRASQNSYMSQQEQVFTILASQSDYQPSFQASLNSQSPYTSASKRSDQEQGTNKINTIFTNIKRRRNKNMQQFKQSNLKKSNAYISMIDNNKIRFNKQIDKSSYDSSSPSAQAFVINTGNKKISVRKYKVGELPDVQISTKDLMDPMIFLAGCDHQFASELFILIFVRICMASRKEKKEKFKETICKLLTSSISHEYNFISTLQKCLICLCHNLKQKIDFSMKDIATKSSTLDYAIVFTEENQIQTLRQPDYHNQQAWNGKVEQIWGDLVDLYQQINEEDLIYGVLIRLATGDERKLLLEALNLKKLGNIKKSEEFLNAALNQTNSRRIKQFIGKQKIDCSTILGDWQPVTIQMNRKMQTQKLSINEQKIFTIALQNTKIEQKSQFLKKVVFHETKCQYEKAILQILYEKGYDAAYIHLQKSIEYFSEQWKKISSFAFNSKHGLLQQVQKKFELQQFLELYRKDEIQKSEYEDLFTKWSNRQPNSVYDSNLTFLQILQSRKMFSDLLSQKFNIDEKFTIRSTIDWLIQMANGMVEKGVLGGAETLIKKALICKRKQKEFFIWDFYDSVARLKLKQLLSQKNRTFNDYLIVANLVKKQMEISQSQISQLQKLKFISLKNTLFEAYISSTLSSQKPIITADFINKIDLIYGNYTNQIPKKMKQNIFQASTSKQFQKYRREMFFQFTLFLEKLLSLVGQKSSYPELRQSMIAKNYNPERLAQCFVQNLCTSIEYSDFSSTMGNLQQNMVLSLIMKLIKIIQLYPSRVGQLFADKISNKNIPVWIFLYFIPQMIKFINNPSLVNYFEDLFRSIANLYPQALIYHFNCSFELEKDRLTPFCQELHTIIREKMVVNYRFIDALVLLQYPEIRLRQSLNRFLSYEFERENSVFQLKQLVQDNQFLGKYNKKFVQDWQSKITRVINKIKSNDLSVMADIKTILTNIDPSNRENGANLASVMRDFVKVSDGSLFYEEYNSNDWTRIEIPGTSYRKFQEPKPWKKVFIESFDHSLLTLQSKQKPRRITVYGSNQKKYMLLVKTGQDVRLDQRIEQMFEIMNRILKENSDCSKKQLQIRRFQVTPIKKMMGIFEWVDQSQTLKQFLETQFKIMKETDKVNLKDRNKAFQYRMELLNKLSPPGMGNKDPNHQHKALLSANKPDVVRCFMECQKQIPYGLLRRALERLSKNYDSFLHIKNSFIANYALICCVTYILGIGDRHLENFLIHMGSASVVPIDFGFSFGASFELGVPELMPFRLTKSFQELMDPIGEEGVFKKSMISSFEAFSQNISLISGYCEVFVDDPLIQWIWSNKKNVSQSKNVQFSSSQDPPQKAHFAEKVLSVRKKLQGCNPRMLFQNMLKNSRHKHANYAKVLSDAIWGHSKNRQKNLNISDVVEQLISMATDKNILGRTYIGWNPYV